MADDLTDKQRLFCHEYMKDFNGTQAAIREVGKPKYSFNGIVFEMDDR